MLCLIYKTSVKTKTAAKKAVKPVVPVGIPTVVAAIRGVTVGIMGIADIPKSLTDARAKLGGSIDRFAARVAKSIANADKVAERNAAKAVRAVAKTERSAERRDKKVAAHKALLAKAAKLQAELDGTN